MSTKAFLIIVAILGAFAAFFAWDNTRRDARNAEYAAQDVRERAAQGLAPRGRIASEAGAETLRARIERGDYPSKSEVIQILGLPEWIVSEPGGDNDVVGLDGLSAGEADYWWVTRRYTAPGISGDETRAGIRFDTQGRARHYISGHRMTVPRERK